MKTKLNLHQLGIAISGGLPAGELRATAREAEELGLRSFWISEDYYNGGAMATAGYVAAVTEKLEIGVGVVNPYTRNPAILAMEAAAIDKASEGRFILTLGASNPGWIEKQMCIPYQKPKTRLFESIEAVRDLIRGEELNRDGGVISARGVRLDFSVYRRDMPVFVGVSREKSLREGGRVADGVLLSLMSAPEYVRWARGIIDASAAEAGRAGRIPVYVYVPLFLGSAEEGAKAFASTVGYFVGGSWDRPFIQKSCPPDGAERLAEAFRSGGDPAAYVTPEIAAHYGIIGDAETCLSRLQEYYDAGADQVIFCACDRVSARDMIRFARSLAESRR